MRNCDGVDAFVAVSCVSMRLLWYGEIVGQVGTHGVFSPPFSVSMRLEDMIDFRLEVVICLSCVI